MAWAISQQRRVRKELWLPRVIFLLLLAWPLLCSAQVQGVIDHLDGGIRSFDSVAKALVDSAKGWVSVLQGYARRLFMALATIQIAWTALQHAMSGEPHVGGALGAVLKEVVILGFFAILIDQGPSWGSDIIVSLQEAGRVASGGGHDVKPQHLLDAAAELGTKTIQEASLLSLAQSGLGMALGGLAVLVCVAAVGGLTLVGWAQAWVVLGAGSILLGLGGSVWTRSMATGYLRHALGAGVKLMTLELIQGVLLGQMQLWIAKANGDGLKLELLATILVSSVAMVIMMLTVPAYVSAIVSGAVIHAGESAVTKMAMAGAFLGGQTAAAKVRGARSVASSIAGSGFSSTSVPGLVGAGGPSPMAAVPSASTVGSNAAASAGEIGGGPSSTARASSVAAMPSAHRFQGGASAQSAGRPTENEHAKRSGKVRGASQAAASARLTRQASANGPKSGREGAEDAEAWVREGNDRPAAMPSERASSTGGEPLREETRDASNELSPAGGLAQEGSEVSNFGSSASVSNLSGAGSVARRETSARSESGGRGASTRPTDGAVHSARSMSGGHAGGSGLSPSSGSGSLGAQSSGGSGGGFVPRGERSRERGATPLRESVKHEGRTRLERALDRVDADDGEENSHA